MDPYKSLPARVWTRQKKISYIYHMHSHEQVITNWDASSFSVDAIAQTPTASTNKLHQSYVTGNHFIWLPLDDKEIKWLIIHESTNALIYIWFS